MLGNVTIPGGSAVTLAVGTELTVVAPVPSLAVAVSTISIVCPTSAAVRGYVPPTGWGLMGEQAPPAQDSQTSTVVKVPGGSVQVPGMKVRVCPCLAVPEIDGGELLTGGAAVATPAVTEQVMDAASRHSKTRVRLVENIVIAPISHDSLVPRLGGANRLPRPFCVHT
jgi:hypothetical protein